jgi:hypothetical protein
MRYRADVSPAEKWNETIDRCPSIKSREICTSPQFLDPNHGELERGTDFQGQRNIPNNFDPRETRPADIRTEKSLGSALARALVFTGYSHYCNRAAIGPFQSTAGRASPLRPREDRLS